MQFYINRYNRTNNCGCNSRPSRICCVTASDTSSLILNPVGSRSKCWLVGAGLGPSDYLTIKAARLIREADVIIHDDLGTGDALHLASEDCEKIYVGKRGGRASMKQEEINAVLVEACTKGPAAKKVVRLKGGDPAVFSRVSSELSALSDAGIPYEIVPGVSSALAAPILAGITLTDAKVGSAFAVVSGHDVEGTDWSAFSSIPTLVILMAGRGLPKIVDKLLAASSRQGSEREAEAGPEPTNDKVGWEPGTPVAVVRSAGLPQQRVWYSTLSAVALATSGEELSPCVVVIGKVVGLRDAWRGAETP